VPFRRDVDFVDRRITLDRRTLLEQIEQRCAVPAARLALVGTVAQGELLLLRWKISTNTARQVPASHRVLLPPTRSITQHVGLLDPRKQYGPDRARIPRGRGAGKDYWS
jgi:hypothetical protein